MNADNYFASLPGELQSAAQLLRAAILKSGSLGEGFKHGHPIYSLGGTPICLIKGAKSHLLLAFWEGQSFLDLEPKLAATGSASMASLKVASIAEAEQLDIKQLIEAATGFALKKSSRS